MSGLETAAWLALRALIQATWPTVTRQLRRGQLNRSQWEALVASGNLVTPWVVLEAGPSTGEDWGLDNEAFRLEVRVTLVLSGAGSDLEADAILQLGLLRKALIEYTGPEFQLAGDTPRLDASDENRANVILYRLQAGLHAGELNARLLIGETPS